MMRKQPKLRTIGHNAIQLGDEISVSGYIWDIKITRTGTVKKRDIRNGTTEYLTEQGVSLFEVYKDGSSSLRSLKILLKNRPADLTLFEWKG